MKQYEAIGGIKVYASSPDDANVEFCEEAEKYGIYLYEVKRFNPVNISFETCDKQFGYGHPPKMITSGDQILLLPKESMLYGYAVIDKAVFEKFYKPLDYKQESLMPENRLKGKSFYLDAGHGGKDSGAVNNNLGLHEKIAALDVCLFIGEFLEKYGAKIYYSRPDDSYPSLTARANDANAKNVDAFISIHLNSADNKSASGIETLVYGFKGIAYELAEKVQANMVQVTGWKNRGVKARPELTVLKKTKMPAILCEIGFISNDEQAKELFKHETQKKVAYAIGNGIIAQFCK